MLFIKILKLLRFLQKNVLNLFQEIKIFDFILNACKNLY